MKSKKVSIGKVMRLINRRFQAAGQQTIYAILLLVNTFKRRTTPLFAKRIIIGILGYFIAPIDAIPDLTPIIGFTDDLGVVFFSVVTIASYITDDIRIESRQQVKRLFGELDLEAVQVVDAKL